MKHILITGANSFIGVSFDNYMRQFSESYHIDTLDMTNSSWRDKSFAGYDSVFHVAGIAHSDSGKISAEKEKLYRSINTDLAIETAKKSKSDGVMQFIFMSSAIVYGNSAPIGKEKIINKDTLVSPANCYGDSKLQAEIGLNQLNDDVFKVVILRPPIVYGKGSKGNYPKLTKLANKLPVFPYIKNQHSMLYIENLCEFVRLMIDNNEFGTFFPQNAEYSNTSEMIRMIAETHGKKILLVKGFAWLLKFMSHFTMLVNKAFGNMVYEQSISEYKTDYRLNSLKDSIKFTEEATKELKR